MVLRAAPESQVRHRCRPTLHTFLTIATDASPRAVLQVVTACGRLLSSTVTTTSPHAHAWHWEACDPTGFAAMGVTVTLLHTYDITQGLGVP